VRLSPLQPADGKTVSTAELMHAIHTRTKHSWDTTFANSWAESFSASLCFARNFVNTRSYHISGAKIQPTLLNNLVFFHLFFLSFIILFCQSFLLQIQTARLEAAHRAGSGAKALTIIEFVHIRSRSWHLVAGYFWGLFTTAQIQRGAGKGSGERVSV